MFFSQVLLRNDNDQREGSNSRYARVVTLLRTCARNFNAALQLLRTYLL